MATKQRTVVQWAFGGLGFATLATFISLGVWATVRAILAPATPPAPERPPECIESAEIVSVNDSARSCRSGRIVTTDTPGGYVLVRCVCEVPDAAR
jgi:hypothetical protein